MAINMAGRVEMNAARKRTGTTPLTSAQVTGGPGGDIVKTSATPQQWVNGATPKKTQTAQPFAPAPSTIPYSPPGYGEQFWSSTGDQWRQPGAANQYWEGQKGWFTGPTPQETTQDFYANVLNTHNSTPLENLYKQYTADGTFSNPGQSEKWYAENGSAMNAPGEGESAISRLLPRFDQTGDMENYFSQNKGYFQAPGQMEDFAAKNSGQLLGPSALLQHEGGISSDINSARNMDRFFNATGGDLARQGYTESLANYGGPSSSYSENMMNDGSAMGGLDQLYNRLYDTGAQKLDRASAARGGYNSGATLRIQEELGKDLSAQHVKDYMSAAGQADSSMMNRLGYGLNLATSGDSAMRDRLNLGFQGAQGVDQGALARAAASSGLYKDIGSERRSDLGLAGEFADKAQASGLARILGGGSLANLSQTALLNRLKGGVDAGNILDTLGQNRFKLGSDASHTAQGDAITRYKMALDAANATQTQIRSRITDSSNITEKSYRDALDRIMAGGDLARGAGQEDIQRRTGGQNAANSAQSDQQNRESSVFDNLLRQAQAQGGAYSGGMDQIRREQLQSKMAEIDGLLKSGQISAEHAQQLTQYYMQMLQMPLAAGSAIAGAPPRTSAIDTSFGSGSSGDWNGSAVY